MFRDLGVAILIVGLNSSMAFSEELPNIFLGTWSESSAGPAQTKDQCSDDAYQIGISRNKEKIEISGGSGDNFCTWTNGRNLDSETEAISGITADIIVYAVKSQCEKIDEGRYPPGTSIITYIRRTISGRTYEELYIGSAAALFSGFYRRCKK